MPKAGTPINPFDLTNYAGGGSIFKSGRYLVERSVYTIYDFNGKGKDTLCHMLELQPLNSKGKPEGEVSVRYASVGDGVSGINPIKGQKGCWEGLELDADSEYDKLWRGSDHFVFMEYLAKAGFDMDSVDNDITELDGLDAQFNLINKDNQPIATTKDDKGNKEKPRVYQVVVVSEINKPGAASKTKGKAEPEEKLAKGKTKDKAEPEEDDAETILEKFLDDEIITKANRKGVNMLTAKVGLRNWMRDNDVEPATSREVQASFADGKTLLAALTAKGWTVEDEVLQPEA